MEIKPAHRVSSIKPYFFADLQKTIIRLQEAGVDVIRLDMGSPDLPPEDFIIDALIEAARQTDMHGYGQAGGSEAHRAAFADYYRNRFDINLDPKTEVLGLIGSKEGVFNLSQVLLNREDLVLVPDPCYPVYAIGSVIAQANTYNMPLLPQNDFLPDLDSIPPVIAEKAKIMWLNYPNNPTGAVASLEFFQEVIDFAKRYNILVAHDAPYVDVCFDDFKAPSILQVPGAKVYAVEFNSISKTYNMAGWRVGVAVGNPEIIRLLQIYKSQLDSSHFKPIMKAAEAALTSDQSWLKKRNHIYQTRRDIIVETLRELGFILETPKASLYVWAKLPKFHQDSVDFCKRLLEETGVSVTPGVVYGKSGAGFIRISIVTPEKRLSEAMHRMSVWMRETV